MTRHRVLRKFRKAAWNYLIYSWATLPFLLIILALNFTVWVLYSYINIYLAALLFVFHPHIAIFILERLDKDD